MRLEDRTGQRLLETSTWQRDDAPAPSMPSIDAVVVTGLTEHHYTL